MRVALASRAAVSRRATATRRANSSPRVARRDASPIASDDARTVAADMRGDDAATGDATTTRRRALARVTTLAAALVTVDATSTARAASSVDSLYDLTLSQYGEPRALRDFRGKVVVVVNVASE